VLIVKTAAGSLNLERIIDAQFTGGGTWFVLVQPLAFLLLDTGAPPTTSRC
jgi:NADH:ubiquinone oxidoreductase subunit H